MFSVTVQLLFWAAKHIRIRTKAQRCGVCRILTRPRQWAKAEGLGHPPSWCKIHLTGSFIPSFSCPCPLCILTLICSFLALQLAERLQRNDLRSRAIKWSIKPFIKNMNHVNLWPCRILHYLINNLAVQIYNVYLKMGSFQVHRGNIETKLFY